MNDETNTERRCLLDKKTIAARINSTAMLPSNAAFTLADWEAGDEALPVWWTAAATAIGEVLVASTAKGVCFLSFTNGDAGFALADLERRFANKLIQQDAEWQKEAIRFLTNPRGGLPVHLHLKGTPFQLMIWKKLALIPFGGLVTYAALGNGARYARAAGAAVGANPIGYILPCHRVVRSDGSFDRYYWGEKVKRELLAYEDTSRVGPIWANVLI